MIRKTTCWVEKSKFYRKSENIHKKMKNKDEINDPENTLYRIFKRKRKFGKNIKIHNVKRYLISQ